ncbi:LysR family transcriptional regulator [Aliidiomarina celeris]|uniref:LysR family transcriptional regulator n=1 Tax=Aliidiomarina celeris TaxID=2249428 RepID=UPI001E2AE67C|nr:LysR family transcriptional regulator [Aliidiomarina celeris]
MELKQLDLNLLLVLQELINERHVSRAASALAMSQPAMSRALQRLRKALSDPILVRVSGGYDLSARAQQMAPELARIIQALEHLIEPPQFEPSRDQFTLKITGLDLELGIYLPTLFRRIRKQAPFIKLETVRQQEDSFPMLERNEVHFSLSGLAPVRAQSSLHRKLLDEMPMVCLMSEQHPLAHEPMTAEGYAAAMHGIVSITGKGPATMDAVLAEHHLQREVAVRLAGFMSVADFCEHSDLLFTLPKRLAERIQEGRKLCIRPLPECFSAPKVSFYLYWHERYHNDPRMQWVREQLTKTID